MKRRLNNFHEFLGLYLTEVSQTILQNTTSFWTFFEIFLSLFAISKQSVACKETKERFSQYLSLYKDDLKELPTIPSNCAIIKCLLDPALVSFLDKLDGPVFISTFWCWGFKTVDHDKFSKHQSVQVSEDWWEVSRTFILWRTAWGVKNELFLKFFEILKFFCKIQKS